MMITSRWLPTPFPAMRPAAPAAWFRRNPLAGPLRAELKHSVTQRLLLLVRPAVILDYLAGAARLTTGSNTTLRLTDRCRGAACPGHGGNL